MGLDLYVGEGHVARWSYPGFNRFRTRLAQAIGIDLDQMFGFKMLPDGYELDLDARPWEGIDDSLTLFLDHSDCDGELSPEACRSAGRRIKQTVSSWPEGDYDREEALKLAAGMEIAARHGEELRFR